MSAAAANKTTTQEQNPAPTKRSFEFKTILTLAPPPEAASASRAPSANDLPFKAWFTEQNAALKADPKLQPSIFIPDAYWIEERGAKPADVNSGYGRSKVTDQFRKWQMVHAKGKNTKVCVKGHEGVYITAVYHKKGIDGSPAPEAGLQVWLLALPTETPKAEG